MSPNRPNRPTDSQLTRALRGALPAEAVPGLHARIRAEVAATPQRRAGGWSVLAVPDPRLRAVLLAAALLLALALGTLIVGSVVERTNRPDGDLLLAGPVRNGLIAVSANPLGIQGGQNGDIYLVADGDDPRRIIGAGGDGIAQACPQFAPDGRRLAFGESLASGRVQTFRGDWPVDGRAVAVTSLTDDGTPTGPVVRVMLPPGEGPMVCPEWSPTGAAVALRVDEQLWIADAVSGDVRMLPIDGVSGPQSNELAWSRDGSKIAVAERGQIRLVDVGSGESTVIAVGGDVPRSLAWTAGDERLVYVAVVPVDEVGSGVHVVGVDGTNDRLLSRRADAPGVTYTSSDSSVSPDGTQVAFLQESRHCTSDSCGPGPEVAPIVIVDVANSAASDVGLPGDGPLPDGRSVDWSPDGTRLLLSSIGGIASIGLDAAEPAIDHATEADLNLEWSFSELSWQAVQD